MRTLLIVAIALAAGCRNAPRRVAVDFDRGAETKAVYEALIRRMWIRNDVEHAVLNPNGFSGIGLQIRERLRNELPNAGSDTLRDYVVQSQEHNAEIPIPRDIDVGVPTAWFTQDDWMALLAEAEKEDDELPLPAAWARLGERYPNRSGWISVSAVGFSRDGRQALVATSGAFASLSSSVHVVLMEKRCGTWRVANSFIAIVMENRGGIWVWRRASSP